MRSRARAASGRNLLVEFLSLNLNEGGGGGDGGGGWAEWKQEKRVEGGSEEER